MESTDESELEAEQSSNSWSEVSTDESELALQIEAEQSSNSLSVYARCNQCSGPSSSYHIVFSDQNDENEAVDCYVIKVSDDRRRRKLLPISTGEVQNPFSWTPLGHQLYSIAGQMEPLRDVWTLDVTRHHEGWKSGPPMLCPRSDCRILALDGKLFVFGGCDPSSHWGEFFDPVSGTWNALPDPPSRFDDRDGNDFDKMICVPLKDSNTILVASFVSEPINYIFFTYNVATSCWATLAHLGSEMKPTAGLHGWKAVAARNRLYWTDNSKDKIMLIAYDLDRDMWLEGRLNWLLIRGNESGFYNSNEHLVHLGGSRFCALLQFKSKFEEDKYFFYRVIIDVGHDFDREKLRISVVSTKKYETVTGETIACCHLLWIEHDQCPHVTPSRSTLDRRIEKNHREESAEVEVIQGLSTRMETVKRHLDEIERGLPGKMDSVKRHLDEIESGLPRKMDSVKKHLDEIESSLQREIDSMKKHLDEIEQGPGAKDMRKREHCDGDEICRGMVQDSERGDKVEYQHSKKQLDNDNDKEVVSRHGERADGVKNWHENLDDHPSKRRKDDKEEILHGHRQSSSPSKQEREEALDACKGDDQL